MWSGFPRHVPRSRSWFASSAHVGGAKAAHISRHLPRVLRTSPQHTKISERFMPPPTPPLFLFKGSPYALTAWRKLPPSSLLPVC